ncbi:DUF58 domain-containing protein [Vallicoccus soli]|uniref:DUF58 domain-containing protein n=1 Tax=Vallicoccus soli TaxID=2339232 RepID=A0A3A3ZLD0_9ACTN|nr:DUF58 domain-containing protein [Vallicoccus soli]RJK96996.1 DUF58 domain-containing protein [Vallicoccus soli]
MSGVLPLVPGARPGAPGAPEAALRRLELTVTRRLDGLLQGQHLGLVPGHGSEPAESREYVPGEDDVRRMDWAVTARTTVPHVRDLVADRELETTLVVDASASMDFGTALMEKRDLAAGAAAAVGFLTLRGGNRLGAVVAHERGVRRLPAAQGREPLLRLLRLLVTAPRSEADRRGPAPGGADLAAALGTALAQARRRGLVVVVSDFLDGDPVDGDVPWERPLRLLAARHDVLAVEVADPREHELPDVGLLAVVDPETGARRDVWTGSRRLRERYAAAAAERRDALAAVLRRSGARHLALRTDRDWVRDVARHVLAERRTRALGARR